MIVYIYSLLSQKKVASPIAESYESFAKDPKNWYPSWDTNDHISTEKDYGEDVVVNSNGVREMEREELILIKNKIELLVDGEYVSKGKIIIVTKPTNMHNPMWNKSINTWEEGSTIEMIDSELNRLFDEFITLDDKKEKYIKNGFPTDAIDTQMKANEGKRRELLKIRDSL